MIKKTMGPLLGMLILLAPVTPAGAIMINLFPVSQTVVSGTALSVDLNISGLGNLGAPSLSAWDVDIGFDAAILSFTGASFGNQLDLFGFGSINGAFDLGGVIDIFEISLDLASDLDTLQADAFTLATLTFDTIGLGTSALTLGLDQLGDSLSSALAATSTGASVTVGRPAISVSEPGTLTLFGVGLAGLVLLCRRRGKCRLGEPTG